MALIRNPSSSVPLDEIKPWNIKVQIIRMWKGNKNESSNSIDMVLLDSSGTKIHTTIDEAFSKWIQNIGDKKINKPKDGEIEIEISEDLLITECKDPLKTMVKEVYGESFTQSYNPDFCQDKAILCRTNDDVDDINDYMLSQLPGEERVYYSADSISPSHSSPNDYMLYPLELLNSINVSGLPKHSLRLKVGALVTLLRDIDPNGGLCNGTRLQITRLGQFVLEARVLRGNNNEDGEKVLIPRMYATPSDANFPIKMRRKQFPLSVAFAMSIHESQSQTLSKVGLYLPRQVFSHVAISKVKSRDGLKILITDKDGKHEEETLNVVFKEVFQKV